MSLISAAELPSPITGNDSWTPVTSALPTAGVTPTPLPTSRSRLRNNRVAAIASATAALISIGSFVYKQASAERHATPGPVPGEVVGMAGDAKLTRADVETAYGAIFGVTGDEATIGCIAAQMGSEGGQAARLASGQTLSFADAQTAFTPFVTCAPDIDFLHMMVPATFDALGASADQQCIESGLTGFNVAERALARALAYSSGQDFANELYSFFSGCLI